MRTAPPRHPPSGPSAAMGSASPAWATPSPWPATNTAGLYGQETTLFLAVQHPGEANGTRREGAMEIQTHQLVDREGGSFQQLRTVPLGSNWPSGVPGRAPRPGIVAIRRLDGGPLLRG